MTKRNSTALVLISTTLAAPAFAQEITEQDGEALGGAEIIALSEWNYDELYAGGVSAEEFIDEMDVYGRNGEEIGVVEDIVVGPEGQVLSIIAQVGGFWDIGDTHVSVPFDEVEISEDGEAVIVPVTEETVGDYGFWNGENADLLTGDTAEDETVEGVDDAPIVRAWRVSELIGDYARLSEDEGYANYGYVNDLILRDGQVASVVVQPAAGYGPGYRAYPYYGYGAGWDAGSPFYDMPYGEEDVGEMEAFEYDRLGS